jgi:hypothetical protein
MPLALPQLDDRTWKDLVEESRALIPSLAPEWTNFNASDPGITLVELFAYLSEALLYRVNRVTDSNRHAFLKLINGPGWHGHGEIAGDMRSTIQGLRRCRLAVTAHDYETLAMTANEQPGAEKVARAHCLTRRNLEAGGAAAQADSPGHVTVLVVPETRKRPTDELLHKVRRAIEPARLITTRVHVVAPRFAAVGVRIALVIGKGTVPATVQRAAIAALTKFFDPLEGGPDGKGWPFGRAVYVSEIYQILTRVPGVVSVTRVFDSSIDRPLDELMLAPAEAARAIRNRAGELEAVALQSDELAAPQLDPADIQVRRPDL